MVSEHWCVLTLIDRQSMRDQAGGKRGQEHVRGRMERGEGVGGGEAEEQGGQGSRVPVP